MGSREGRPGTLMTATAPGPAALAAAPGRVASRSTGARRAATTRGRPRLTCHATHRPWARATCRGRRPRSARASSSRPGASPWTRRAGPRPQPTALGSPTPSGPPSRWTLPPSWRSWTRRSTRARARSRRTRTPSWWTADSWGRCTRRWSTRPPPGRTSDGGAAPLGASGGGAPAAVTHRPGLLRPSDAGGLSRGGKGGGVGRGAENMWCMSGSRF
mmetsp:Transcript_14901/g.38235  ORF Transcript_14901/g.38235 Transcript_14901/m.38235 type:complete len:216 (+) Transcript_14901:652-1299(+)